MRTIKEVNKNARLSFLLFVVAAINIFLQSIYVHYFVKSINARKFFLKLLKQLPFKKPFNKYFWGNPRVYAVLMHFPLFYRVSKQLLWQQNQKTLNTTFLLKPKKLNYNLWMNPTMLVRVSNNHCSEKSTFLLPFGVLYRF